MAKTRLAASLTVHLRSMSQSVGDMHETKRYGLVEQLLTEEIEQIERDSGELPREGWCGWMGTSKSSSSSEIGLSGQAHPS